MRQHKRISATAAVAAALATMAAADAQATTLVALTGNKALVSINAEQRRVISRVQVSGINGQLRCIDVRPADRQLYGVVSDGSVVTINPGNGSAVKKSTLQMTLPAGVRATCDFNPAVDLLRMIGSDGTNLAANVDNGAVTANMPIKFPPPPAVNPFGGTTPSVIGGAYSNWPEPRRRCCGTSTTARTPFTCRSRPATVSSTRSATSSASSRAKSASISRPGATVSTLPG